MAPRILLVDWYSTTPATINAVRLGIRAFEHLGAAVQEFPYLQHLQTDATDVTQMLTHFRKDVATFRPDVVMWWHWNARPFVRAARKAFPTLLFIMYNWDPWLPTHPPDHLGQFDAIFTCCARTMDVAAQAVIATKRPRIYQLLPAFDKEHCTSGCSTSTYQCDISFACTTLYEEAIFAVTQPTPRMEVVEALRILHARGRSVKLYGPAEFRKRFPDIACPFVAYADLPKTFAGSRIVLTHHVAHQPEYVNERTILAMACGATVATDPVHSPLLVHGETCYIYSGKTRDVIANELDAMLTQPPTGKRAAAMVAGMSYCAWASYILKYMGKRQTTK